MRFVGRARRIGRRSGGRRRRRRSGEERESESRTKGRTSRW